MLSKAFYKYALALADEQLKTLNVYSALRTYFQHKNNTQRYQSKRSLCKQ